MVELIPVEEQLFLISCADCSVLFLVLQPDLGYFKSQPVKGTKAIVLMVLSKSFILEV